MRLQKRMILFLNEGGMGRDVVVAAVPFDGAHGPGIQCFHCGKLLLVKHGHVSSAPPAIHHLHGCPVPFRAVLARSTSAKPAHPEPPKCISASSGPDGNCSAP